MKIVCLLGSPREKGNSTAIANRFRNTAEGLVYSTERALEEYGSQLAEVDRELIRSDLDKLKEALGRPSTDVESLDKLYKALEGSAYRIAETVYAQR